MAYNRNRLARIGPNLLVYKTDDAAATVDTAGYFNDDGTILKNGDIINRITVTNIDASNEAVSTFGQHIVNSVVQGNPDVVDVTDTTAGTVTDTD